MSKKLAIEPGRGRKHCPGCNKYPGVRSSVCSGCGHKFLKSVSKKIKLKVRHSNGSKLKIPVSKKAEKKIFLKEVESAKPEEIVESKPAYSEVIVIPAGKPPIELTGKTQKVVKQWMEDTRKAFKGGNLSHEALCYWVRYFYPYFKKDKDGKVISDRTGDKVRKIICKIDGVSPEGEIFPEDKKSNEKLESKDSSKDA